MAPEEPGARGVGWVAFAAALALHVASVAVLPRPDPGEPRGPERVEIAVVEEPQAPEPEPPEPKPEPEPEPEPKKTVPEPPPQRPKPEPEPEAPAPSPPDPEPAGPEDRPPAEEPAPAKSEEQPVRFDNVTLTNEDGPSSWSTPESSGVASDEPLGAPGTRGREDGVRGGVPGGEGRGGGGGRGGPARRGPRVVGLGDLSRRPGAPDLNARLEEHYPDRARRQGVTAVAEVRARINPDGSVGPIRVREVSVDGYGFGKACIRTLRGSTWTPPLDGQGRRVATWITYRCRFRVRD